MPGIYGYKNKRGTVLYCFFMVSFPDGEAPLRNSSSTCYFYVHTVLLNNSRAFTVGNYLLNIPHCLTVWPVDFSQTETIWASIRKHSTFKGMFSRCAEDSGRRESITGPAPGIHISQDPFPTASHHSLYVTEKISKRLTR